jgi:RNA polymerase sigma-70 factor (ECF subfamily)
MDDWKIIAKYQAGDREAFGELYRLWVDRIYNFCYFRTSNKEAAEDLTSDIFLKIYKKAGKLEPFGNSVGAWIYRLARNRVIDYYRTDKKNYNLDMAETVSDDGDWLEKENNRRLLAELKEKVMLLKPKQREIIIMRVWDGLSYKEIAAITGKSEAALKMSFSRALKSLQGSLPADLFVLLYLIIK